MSKPGWTHYYCEACESRVEGMIAELRAHINTRGRAYCQQCSEDFFGRYDSRNRALIQVIEALVAGKPKRNQTEGTYREEQNYNRRVRSASHDTYLNNKVLINPNNFPIVGTASKNGYHLDHTVPISWCWQHGVSVADASSAFNLQVVHWRVNLARSNHLLPHKMIGLPNDINVDDWMMANYRRPDLSAASEIERRVAAQNEYEYRRSFDR